MADFAAAGLRRGLVSPSCRAGNCSGGCNVLSAPSQGHQGSGFAERRQSKAVENLGLTACKEAAAMRPGQKTNFAADRTYLIKGTAVRTDLIMGNDVTKDLLDKLLHNMAISISLSG